MKINDVYEKLKPMSAEKKKEYQKYFNVTNPTDSANTILFGQKIGPATKSKQTNYQLGGEKLREYSDFYRRKHAKAVESGAEIWKDVTSDFYHNNPQEAIDNFRKAVWSGDNLTISAFDIESIGGLNKNSSNIFTPTEMIFSQFKMNKGKMEKVSSNAFLVSPSQSVQNNLNAIINNYQKGIGLNEDQYRTLKDLMKYSDFGKNYGVKVDNGRVMQHATWVDELIEQHGSIDFNKTYNVNGMLINPMEKVREGLNFLTSKKSGAKDPTQVAKEFANLIDSSGKYYGGHNIKNFDINAINQFLQNNLGDDSGKIISSFSNKNFIDTQQIINSVYQSVDEMLEDFNALDKIGMNKGFVTQEGLAEILDIGVDGQLHIADVDVDTWAKIYEKSQDVLINRVENLNQTPVIGLDGQIVSGGRESVNASGFGFNTQNLSKGDRLISTAGASSTDGTIGFVVDKSGRIKNNRNYLMSQVSYSVENLYETGSGNSKKYGVELLNEATGEKHVVYKNKVEDLQNFIQEKFRSADNVSEDAINYLNSFKEKDLARGRYRKMFSTNKGGGYWTTSRMLEAVEADRKFKTGKITKEQRDRTVNRIFSINGKANDSLIRDFENLKGRLDSEYDILKTMVSETENRLGIKKGSRLTREQNIKASMAISQTYEELVESGLREHREMVQTPITGKHGMTLFGKNNEEIFLNLESPQKTKASLHGILNRISSSFDNDIALQKEYLINIVKNQIAPRLDLSQYEMQEVIHTVEKISKGQKGTGYAVGEVAAVLNKLKKDNPNMIKNNIDVESLAPRSGNIGVGTDDVFEIVNKKLNQVQSAFNLKGKRANKNALKGFGYLKELDQTLDGLYEMAGFSKAKPQSMEESILGFVNSAWDRIGKQQVKGTDLSMRIVNTGSAKSPNLTMQVFNSSNRGALGQSTDAAKNVLSIDLPLISKDGYIEYGNTKRIAPLAFLDRVLGKGGNMETKVHSAFDRVIYGLNNNLDRIINLAAEGNFEEANKLANRSIRKGIESFSNSKYGEAVDLKSGANKDADFLKRFTIHTEGYFNPISSNEDQWYGHSLNNVVKTAEDKVNLIKGIPKLISDEIGDIEVFWGSQRSGDALQGVASLIDIRHDFGLGIYNNAGRDNMIQFFNNKMLTDLSYETLNGNSNVQVGSLFGPSGSTADKTVMAKVRLMNDLEILEAFGDQYDSKAAIPTVWEDQFIFRDDFAQGFESKISFSKTAEGKNLPSIKQDILSDFEWDAKEKRYKGRKKINYMDELYSYRGADFTDPVTDELLTQRFELQGENYLTGIKLNDNGDYVFEFENVSGVSTGTKVFTASEKGTVSSLIDSKLFSERIGEDVSVIANSNYVKHQAFGDIFSGYINNALFEVNKLDKEIKEKKAQELANFVSDVFDMDAVVAKDQNGNISIRYDSEKMLKKAKAKMNNRKEAEATSEAATKRFGNFVDDINKILSDQGISIRKDELMTPIVMADVDENFHFSNLGEGALGKKGAKFSGQEIQNLRLKGMDGPADWLESMISDGRSQAVKDVAKDEADALRYIYDDLEPDKSVNKVSNIFDYVRDIRKGGIENIRGLERGLYTKEALEETLVDPNRDAFMLQLPEEIEVVDSATEKAKKIDEILIGKTDPALIAQSKEYQLSGLPRHQLNVLEAVEDYKNMKAGKEVLDFKGDPLTSETGLDNIQKAVQNYHDFMLKDLTSNKGIVYEDAYSGRFMGSGGGLLQVMNPIPELAEDIELGDSADTVSKFVNSDTPNTVYLGKERALRMVGFNNIDEFEDALKRVNAGDAAEELQERVAMIQNMQGEGHYGLLNRFPTIHRHSTTVSKFKIDDSVDNKGVKLSAVLTNALYGDSDGDRVSFVLANKNINVDNWEKAFKESAELLNNEFRVDTIESLQDSLSRSSLIDEVSKHSDEIVARVGSTFDNQAFVSKTLNPMYTGRLTNLGMNILQMGELFLTEEQDIKNLQEGVGDLIQTSLYGKHINSNEEAVSAIETINNTIKALSSGTIDPAAEGESISNLAQMTIGNKRLFSDDSVNAFMKLAQNVNDISPKMWDSLSADLGLSESVSRKGAEKFVSMLNNNQVAPTESLNQLMNIIGEDVDKENMQKVRAAVEEQVANVQKYRQAVTLESIREDALKAQGDKALKGVAGKMSGKLGFGVAAAATGAFALGAMATAGNDLPMDYVDSPGMRPRRNQSPQAHSSYNYVPGVTGGGYDINIKGKTTIDKDLNELSGIVAQTMQDTTGIPMNININANDNRNNLSDQWIQEQVLKAINS